MISTARSLLPELLQESIDSELFTCVPIKALECNYKLVTATEITDVQKHLDQIEQQELHKLFNQYMPVFDGKPGHYKKDLSTLN